MENLRIGSDERKRMLDFTARALGTASAEWTDRELLVNYNKALALLVLGTGKRIRG